MWSIALYDSETWTLKKICSGSIWKALKCGAVESIKWSEKVTNEQVFERIGEKKTLLNNILRIVKRVGKRRT